MSTEERSSLRPWQEIAAEASREEDPHKLIELTKELERALEKRAATSDRSSKGSAGAA